MNEPISTNVYEKWLRYDSFDEAEQLFQQDCPIVGGFDTETTGLHLISSKPFLLGFGWAIPNTDYGRVFTFYPTEKMLKRLSLLSEKLQAVVMANAKYDLHMMRNIGWEYPSNNIYELQALARLTLDAVSVRDGGEAFKLGLKSLAKNYLHPDADDAEKFVKEEINAINNSRRKILLASLKQFPLPEELGGGVDKRGKEKMWTKKALEDYLKDPTHDMRDLPEEIQEVFTSWKESYPPATYEDAYHSNPEAMIRYLQDDIIATVELYKLMAPRVKARNQVQILKRENAMIKPLMEIERVGLKVDREYLLSSKDRLVEEIKQKREKLRWVLGANVTPNQHKAIMDVYKNRWGIELENAQKDTLKKMSSTLTGDPQLAAKLITDLRTLEKWLSTYCERMLELTEYDGRAYFQINQCGAVSGRVSSDSQQFPKGRILTEEGYAYEKEHGKNTAPDEYELFNPRRAIVPSGNGYNKILYFDYSQIELRIAAHYTIAVMGGDLNLCRAYMPFQCFDETGRMYSYDDPEFRKEWNQKAWVDANGKPWEKTDMHAETAHNALLHLGYICNETYKSYKTNALMMEADDVEPHFGWMLDEKGFEHVRSKGKMFNFMRTYGGGLDAAMKQLDISEAVAQALIDGYDTAFPGLSFYQRKIIESYKNKGYVKNMYGRRYYLSNDYSRSAYKLANFVIQGTGADMIKEAIYRIDLLLKAQKAKSRLILTVHDEVQLELYDGEDYLIPIIKEVMEKADWCKVPVVCDVEATSTNWANKEELQIESTTEKKEVMAS